MKETSIDTSYSRYTNDMYTAVRAKLTIAIKISDITMYVPVKRAVLYI